MDLTGSLALRGIACGVGQTVSAYKNQRRGGCCVAIIS